MKIGQLARKTGKTVRALHLYEEMGLLSPERSEGGFRLYGSDELARVYWISKLQDMGFKLGQIDEELLFYLEARGIPEPEARALLIQAFVGEAIERVEHEGLRAALSAASAEWLGVRTE